MTLTSINQDVCFYVMSHDSDFHPSLNNVPSIRDIGNSNIYKYSLHTCEPLLLDMREIWFSFQGD